MKSGTEGNTALTVPVPQRRALLPSPAWLLYGLFVVFALSTPGWRTGPFTWLPIFEGNLAGRPAAVGLLALLLPAAIIVGIGQWVQARSVSRTAGWRAAVLRAVGPWQIAVPVFGLGLWALLRLRPALAPGVAQIVIMAVLLLWVSYLWLASCRPQQVLGRLAVILAIVVCVQGAVGAAQFWRQGSLGLAALGEPWLNPAVEATSVVGQPGAHHLRAYGLTAHPNVLGGMLAIGLLWLVVAALSAPPRTRAWWLIAIIPGLTGLLLTFSRAAWLGLLVGLAWLVWRWPQVRRWWLLMAVLLVAAVLALIWWQPVLLWTRLFDWSAPLEARSLSERLHVFVVALGVIRAHLWDGVGSGLYLHALPGAGQATAVHNALLLATAELGIVGGVLWLWLGWAWLGVRWPSKPVPDATQPAAGYAVFHAAVASWLTLFVIGLFDNYTWLTVSWRAAIMLGILAGALAAGAQRHSETATGDPGRLETAATRARPASAG